MTQTWSVFPPSSHHSHFFEANQNLLSFQNGGYVNPPPEKRQFRDPYADWWDKQERRNYGEPVHEDNDILGMFSPEEYTHFTSGRAFFLLGCFAASVGALCWVVSKNYADKPSVPRRFPGGLDRELGGPGTIYVSLGFFFTERFERLN